MQQIIVEIIGGLGNQMFQYAFGRAAAICHEAELWLDVSGFASYPLRQFNLGHFRIAGVVSEQSLDNSVPLYEEPHFHFDALAHTHSQSIRYRGYWQSPLYFSAVADRIRTDFQLRLAWPETYQSISNEIQNVESVGVHVRRGDYANNQTTQAFHGLAAPDYFRQAVDMMRDELGNPRFYFFSDDIEWCRGKFEGLDVVFVDIPEEREESGLKACRDLHLMSRCRHNILSNSSFSWWSAWLCDKPDKIVIAPNPWFATAGLDTQDLIPANWRSLPISGQRDMP
ncbi:alpha-1,2-fucosyltransferase [Methylobacterium sp. 391_Methyba4]|uniref:alpha-1,2-fucosyltransferase n=1 Tax=Methylobacterium sp. 391_Methyba4 TaxID=3038924 RepID=UPI00241F6411|nr:alpha-1,2-fucosyltransferase [Methylobacterium sp. 391_Methyba4]WFS09119.1 alpha-1,2-fucosyltransferase [Methylobacterium sp. 391_Methyba4]